MDIVWVYKSQPNSDELLWSIKSTKNLEHGRKLVIGDHPATDEVEHIKPPVTRWSMLSAHHDVLHKLYHATQLDISEDFILMNDDFFVMQPTPVPIAHRGTLDEHIAQRGRTDGYNKTLERTNQYLKSKGIEKPLSYELHIPMVFNKQKLADLFDELLPIIQHASPVLIRSVYGNTYQIGGEFMMDVKTVDDHRGLPYLSTNEATFRGEKGDYIKSVLS